MGSEKLMHRSTQQLIDNDVDFTVHNKGYHLIITYPKGIIDFWPSTGRWIHRGMEDYTPEGHGITELLYYMGIDPPKPKGPLVWVVERGEKHEGGSVEAVTSSLETAMEIRSAIWREENFFPDVDFVRIRQFEVKH